MDKHLVVYPISTGNELNVFSSQIICAIKVMDMSGNVWIGQEDINGMHNTIDIRQLPGNTYIVEVLFQNNRSCRSVFVKNVKTNGLLMRPFVKRMKH